MIHAEGVRLAVASSAQRKAWKTVSRQGFIGQACPETILTPREIAAWHAAVATNKRENLVLDVPVALVTFGEQSMAISRERRSLGSR